MDREFARPAQNLARLRQVLGEPLELVPHLAPGEAVTLQAAVRGLAAPLSA